LLGSNDIEMYLFGKNVETLFMKYIMCHENFKQFKQKVRKCQRIHHYSGRVRNFEDIAPIQLGLSDLKKSNIKAPIYDALWE